PSGSLRVIMLSVARSIIVSDGLLFAPGRSRRSRTSSIEVIVGQQLPPQESPGMSRLRFRDDEGSNTTTILAVLAGAVGGFALGMFVAQRVGGLEGLTSRLKKRKA